MEKTENKELLELQKKEGIKLVYIKLLNDIQTLAGTLKVDAENFKEDKETAEIFKEYGDKMSELVSKLSARVANM